MNEQLKDAITIISWLRTFDLSMQTIRYMAIIAEADAVSQGNAEAEIIFRKVIRYCDDPERRASVEARQEKRLEEMTNG